MSSPQVRPLVEIAVDTLEDGRAALDAGADRLEVCSRLSEGGCTPERPMFEALRRDTGRPLFVMVRNRNGDFVYTDDEMRKMLRDMEQFIAAGADGFVFGALTSGGMVDRPRLGSVVRMADGSPLTFHRAFDRAGDRTAALQDLRSAGVARVLTSGGAPTAIDGAAVVRQLVHASKGGLTVVAGGGVRPDHAVRLVESTGVAEVHSSARDADGRFRAETVRELVAALTGGA